MSMIQSNCTLLGLRASVRRGTARCSTVRSIEYSRQGKAITASPIHSRFPAFGAFTSSLRRFQPWFSDGAPLLTSNQSLEDRQDSLSLHGRQKTHFGLTMLACGMMPPRHPEDFTVVACHSLP